MLQTSLPMLQNIIANVANNNSFYIFYFKKSFHYKMSRYRNAKIYKLVSNKNGLIYVGSTCLTLPQRLSQHERDYKQYLKTGQVQL